MKRTLSVILTVLICAALIIPFIPAGAADIYEISADGDILYQMNFNGDERYKPAHASGNMIVTVDTFDSGKATFENPNDKEKTWWGGVIDDLPLNDTNLYTIYWSVHREAKAAIGCYVDDTYGCYGYADKIKFMNKASSLSGHDYATFDSKGYNVDAVDQDYAMEVNCYNQLLTLYVKDNVTGKYEEFDTTESFEIPFFNSDKLGIYFYIYYANQISTISNCYVTKGLAFGKVEEIETDPVTTKAATTAEVTTAAVTTAESTIAVATTAEAKTDAPETKAPDAVTTQAAPEKNGCGSAVAALPVILAVIGGALAVRKRK